MSLSLPSGPQDVAEALLAYADQRYEEGGWDVLVECWSVGELAQELLDRGVTTLAGAVAAFSPVVAVWADRQADARNSAF